MPEIRLPDKPSGLLAVGFDYSTAAADEFHDWYDTEHISERQRVPGFQNAERWLALINRRVSLATYDLQGRNVLHGQAYKAIAGPNLSPWSKRLIGKCRSLCRFEAEQLFPGNQVSSRDANGLLLIAIGDTAESQIDRHAWFGTRGIPRTLTLPGLLTSRSFQTDDKTLIAMYQYRYSTPADSEAWRTMIEPSADNDPPPFTGKPWKLLCTRYST